MSNELKPEIDQDLTIEQASELVGDDIAYWLSSQFMTPEMLAQKAAWWIGRARSLPPAHVAPGDLLAAQLRGLAADPHARAVLAKAFREAPMANASEALHALADGLSAGAVLRPEPVYAPGTQGGGQ